MEQVPGKVASDLADEFEATLRRHDAFAQLERFGRLARLRPFTQPELEVFFASLWVFFEEVPTGILALALNVCDATRHGCTWQSTELAAKVLVANVDEFGLRNPADQTHHQLFLALVQRLGLSGPQLLGSQRIFASAYRLAGTTRSLYRSPDIMLAMGLHLASELTSSVEFGHFEASFAQHASVYGLDLRADPEALVFFHIHTLVEPEHYAGAVELASQIATRAGDSSFRMRITAGAQAFLDDFGALFRDFNQMLDSGL